MFATAEPFSQKGMSHDVGLQQRSWQWRMRRHLCSWGFCGGSSGSVVAKKRLDDPANTSGQSVPAKADQNFSKKSTNSMEKSLILCWFLPWNNVAYMLYNLSLISSCLAFFFLFFKQQQPWNEPLVFNVFCTDRQSPVPVRVTQ